MSTVIKLKNVNFNNPALPVVDTSKHPAQVGLAAEYDMLTFDTATQLRDLSGNGKHATFNATPTLSSYGWIANGGKRAVTPLSSLGSNMSGFIVARVSALNYTDDRFMIANWGGYTGGLLRTGGASGSKNFGWQMGGPDKLTSLSELVVQNEWALLYFYIGSGGASNLKNLTKGTVGTTPVASGLTSDRAWVIGGGYDVSNADTIASQWDLTNAEVAYCGFYNKVLTANQEAYLKDYITNKMLARGITV